MLRAVDGASVSLIELPDTTLLVSMFTQNFDQILRSSLLLLPCAAARMSEWDWAKSYKKFEKYKVEEDDGEIKPQNIEEFLDQSRSQQ